MKENKLIIKINKSIQEVFLFTITPPNSTFWIPLVISEETNEWPVRKGTIYKLKDKNGEYFEAIVTNFIENKLIEWVSKDNNYHCRYSYKLINSQITQLEYYEWVDRGEIDKPFTNETLNKLKNILEN